MAPPTPSVDRPSTPLLDGSTDWPLVVGSIPQSLNWLGDAVSTIFSRSVRLTDERLAHILEHPEMAGMEDELARVLQSPSEVRLSRSDDNVRLFYEFYTQTQWVGNG